MKQDASLHYTIYLDRLFVEYLLVYILLMLLVGMLLHRKAAWKRLLFCGALWSMTGIACLLLPVGIRRWGCVMAECLTGTLLFRFLYGRVHKRMAGGVVLALLIVVMYLTGCFQVSYRLEKLTGVSGLRFLTGTLLTALLLIWLFRQRGKTLYHVSFLYRGKEHEIVALLDTGNGLREPISGKAVCVVEESSIQWNIREEKEGVYMIPYHAVGTDAGMLPAVKVHQVKIMDSGGVYQCQEMLLAVYHGRLSSHGKYQMLLHTDYLKERDGLC
ncbi:MAG: sigma-E processing peptidase SpoIIGA [Lachnospiraceae bacterium]|nr:sigma-E processing peptidase SpoIIGA [Lachnospiraceae bacterium]